MKKWTLMILALFGMCAWGGTLRAEDAAALASDDADAPEKRIYNADTAYAFLTTLSGDWRAEDGDEPEDAVEEIQTFRVSGAGSTVINTIFPGERSEMVSIFMRDGEDLILTHYCALQNQPVMKFEACDKPGVIKFVFHGGTNFDPAVDAHVHEGEIVIRSKNVVESNFTAYLNGKPLPIGVTTLTRK